MWSRNPSGEIIWKGFYASFTDLSNSKKETHFLESTNALIDAGSLLDGLKNISHVNNNPVYLFLKNQI